MIPPTDCDPMEAALLRIRRVECERTWGKGYACITDPSRNIDDEDGPGHWCDTCIAHHGLRFSQYRNERAA